MARLRAKVKAFFFDSAIQKLTRQLAGTRLAKHDAVPATKPPAESAAGQPQALFTTSTPTRAGSPVNAGVSDSMPLQQPAQSTLVFNKHGTDGTAENPIDLTNSTTIATTSSSHKGPFLASKTTIPIDPAMSSVSTTPSEPSALATWDDAMSIDSNSSDSSTMIPSPLQGEAVDDPMEVDGFGDQNKQINSTDSGPTAFWKKHNSHTLRDVQIAPSPQGRLDASDDNIATASQTKPIHQPRSLRWSDMLALSMQEWGRVVESLNCARCREPLLKNDRQGSTGTQLVAYFKDLLKDNSKAQLPFPSSDFDEGLVTRTDIRSQA